MKSKNLEHGSVLRKVANAEDEDTGDAFEIFDFKKVLNSAGSIRVEREKSHNVDYVYSLLLRKNADLGDDDAGAIHIIENAMRAPAEEYHIYANHVGWRPNLKGFVLGQIVLFSDTGAEGARELKPPLWLSARQMPSFTTSGTIEEWVERVAKPARFSDIMQLIVGSSFGANLVKPAKMSNFGINVEGRSKTGKSGSLLVGTSVYGVGTERALPNWSSTSGGFLETARVFNDLLMPLNEVGLLAGKRKDAYGPIRERIYAFSEGRDRIRMSGSSMATANSSASWQGIFVSTSEHSFNSYAALSGETRSAGEYARCLDVPAVRKGRSTVFDRFPKGLKNKRKWARQQLVAIRKACEEQHGTALKPFLMYVSQIENLPDRIQVLVAHFVQRVVTSGLDSALLHAAQNFGLIYAGGALAIEAGILPWKLDAYLKAVIRCFEAGVADAIGHENALALSRKTFKKKMASLKFVDLEKEPAADLSTAVAYRERVSGKLRYTILASEFRGWFSNMAQRVAILRWLFDSGYLERGDKAGAPSARSTEWAERGIRWKGHVRKSFVLLKP